MKTVGIFLGVQPNAGGMFQYAQSVLDGLMPLLEVGIKVKVAYVGQDWRPVLSSYPFEQFQIRSSEFGLVLASFFMVVRLPGRVARIISPIINPIVIQMQQMGCTLWIFPAQDILGYQVPFPSIVSIHDLMHRYEKRFPEVSAFGRFGIREHRFRNLVKWSHLVLVDSDVGRKHVVESYGVDPARVEPLPYVAPRYIFKNEPADFDERYDLPKKFIFYPAQFWAHKNHKLLVAAAAVVREKCPDICLVFAGHQGHLYDQIIRQADMIGVRDRINFTGYVPDSYLSGFYRRARALIMPTFFGPTNIPPLEAFACECPVAVSNIYGMPEQARGAALLFNPESTSSIVAALEQLWNDDDLCTRLTKAGIINALEWNQKKFSQKLTGIVEKIVEPKK